MSIGQLISRNCTTGWADRSPGELILTDLALVRIRLDDGAPAIARGQSTVPEGVVTREVPDPTDRHQVIELHPTNRYILLAELAEAELHHGSGVDKLIVTMRDEGRFKLIWPHADPAYRVLADKLPKLLPRGLVTG